ncbi:MAG: hypothetical protein WCP39_04740 [Chlamydiota bacterium]
MNCYFFISLLFLAAQASCLCLQDFLQTGEKGDFFVTENQKMISLILIREKINDELIFEEISLPEEKKPTISWQDWIEKNAPGNISWQIFSLNLSTHKIDKCYSFTEETFLQLQEDTLLLPKLSILSLNLVPKEQRKKIGPPPPPGEIDRRGIFFPSCIIEGKPYKGTFEVYRGIWPKDGSPFADKIFDFYFAKNQAFPFWIHIDAGHITIMFRVIDTGKRMISPKPFPFLFQQK